jgi:hypothetical protein
VSPLTAARIYLWTSFDQLAGLVALHAGLAAAPAVTAE